MELFQLCILLFHKKKEKEVHDIRHFIYAKF